MNDPQNMDNFPIYAKYSAVIAVKKMPILGPQQGIFRDERAPPRESFKGRDLIFKPNDEFRSLRRTVCGDISPDLLDVFLCR